MPDLSFEGRDDFVVVVVVVSAVSLNDDNITSASLNHKIAKSSERDNISSTSLNDKIASTSLGDNTAATASLRENVAKVWLHEKV